MTNKEWMNTLDAERFFAMMNSNEIQQICENAEFDYNFCPNCGADMRGEK